MKEKIEDLASLRPVVRLTLDHIAVTITNRIKGTVVYYRSEDDIHGNGYILHWSGPNPRIVEPISNLAIRTWIANKEIYLADACEKFGNVQKLSSQPDFYILYIDKRFDFNEVYDWFVDYSKSHGYRVARKASDDD